jgi:cytochrome c oxidase subunit 2
MPWRPPPTVSTFGGSVDQLYWLILAISGVAFLLTEGVLLYSVFRFRARDGGRATYLHGSRRLEVAWAAVPALILFWLAVYQFGVWTDIKVRMPAPDEAVQVQLSPKQFLWQVTYPGPDGQFATPDDIAAPNNVIHVPVNQKVLVTLLAEDVIHSFFVPALRLKQDALPGSAVQAWFEATQTGTYEVACAELCGLGHYKMQAQLTVESMAEFQAWLAERQAAQPSRDQAVRVAKGDSDG